MARSSGGRRELPSHTDPFEELLTATHTIPLVLPTSALDRCRVYVETLLLWRQRLSLTSAATPRSILLHHILDSLYVAPLIQPGARVADIGSGAGFPGVPLAIACPEAHFVLVESRRKKANFLREVIRGTRLSNATVAEQRAEALVDDGAIFDVLVSRAVGPLVELLALAGRLLKPAGLAIAMKGPKGRAEGVSHQGWSTVDVHEYALPGGARHLLLMYRKL